MKNNIVLIVLLIIILAVVDYNIYLQDKRVPRTIIKPFIYKGEFVGYLKNDTIYFTCGISFKASEEFKKQNEY